MRAIVLFVAVSLLAAMPSDAAGVARLRLLNVQRQNLVLDDGSVIPPGGTAIVSVPAGVVGTILGCQYPAIGAGEMGCVRITPPVAVEEDVPNTGGIAREPQPAPEGPTYAGSVIDLFEDVDGYVSVPLEIFNIVGQHFGKEERAAMMKLMDASHKGKIWAPKKFSTIFGSIERIADTWGSAEDMHVLGEIGGIIYLGIRGGKTPAEIARMLADTDVWNNSTHGEAGYWMGAIVAGMINGRSFTDAICDAFDPDNTGFWTTAGYEIGAAFARAHQAFEKWMSKDERASMDMRLLEKLRAAGYGEEAEKALRDWLAMDSSKRAAHPFVLKDEWRKKAGDDVPEIDMDSLWKCGELEFAVGLLTAMEVLENLKDFRTFEGRERVKQALLEMCESGNYSERTISEFRYYAKHIHEPWRWDWVSE